MFTIKKRNLIALLIAAVLLGSCFSAAGFYFAQNNSDGYVRLTQKDYKQLRYMNDKYAKLEQLEGTINANYYKEADQKALETGVYKGLFWGLGDVYSSYLTAEEYENMNIFATGEFEGVGVTIMAGDNGSIVVVSTVEGSPAQKAGIKTGDILLKVDGTAYTAEELDTAAASIRGKSGTMVTLTYSRGGKIIESKIVRTNVVNVSVKAKMLPDNIGYIQILQFENHTGEDFQKELRNMEMKAAKGLVIDLRNNGGGIVDSGIAIADLLLPEGTITKLVDREGKGETYKSDSNRTSLPYVLLVDGGTASTSEILSSAVKDNQGGKIVGTNTFGKGVVQSVSPLPDGDAVKLTIMQYLSPKGNVIDKVGVKPDYAVENVEGDETDYQLEKALELLK